MKQIEIPVKSKGQVVTSVTVDLPESFEEAASSIGEAVGLKHMHYGIRVSAANTARAEATGGPKSFLSQIKSALTNEPEKAQKIARMLGIEIPT